MSMIIVRYINGQTRVVQAQSWRQLDSESAPMGAILLSAGKGGGKLYAVKSSIYEVEEIPQDAFDEMARNRALQAEAEAKARARKPLNRIRRVFGMKVK